MSSQAEHDVYKRISRCTIFMESTGNHLSVTNREQ